MKSSASHKSSNKSSGSSAGSDVHVALFDFDGCAAPMVIEDELSHIHIGLEQIKQFCTFGEKADIPEKVEDPRYYFKSLVRVLFYITSRKNFLPIPVDRKNNTASTIKNEHYRDAMIKFFDNFMGELSDFRNSPILEKQAMLPIVTNFLQVYSAWKKKPNKDDVKSPTLAYKKLARSLKQNISDVGDLDALFTDLYKAIKCFLELFQKLTLGVIICRLFSQGYDPVQHPLIFISASARINKSLDDLGNQQNHNGTVLELMQTLPTLVKNFLRDQCHVFQDDQKTIEFWRNMPLDKSDSDKVQIHFGKGNLHDQSKMGIILWATHLLSRHFKQLVFDGESKTDTSDDVNIKASYFDDLLKKGTTVKGHEKVQYAMQYLEKKPYLLPKGLELSLLGFMPSSVFKDQAILQPFVDQPIAGTGPTVLRHSINNIVNTPFPNPDNDADKSMIVKGWCCFCACYKSSTYWHDAIDRFKANRYQNEFFSSHNNESAPESITMDRVGSDTPLLSQRKARESLFEKLQENSVYQYQCRETTYVCTSTCGFFI